MGFEYIAKLSVVKTQAKTLSENSPIDLEQRRISPRMDLPMSPFSKEMRLMKEATIAGRVDYFNLPRPLWRKLKKCLPKNNRKMTTKGGRPRASDRAVINAQIGTCSLDRMEVEGSPSRLVWGLLKRGP
jgi:hypothetical protein